MESVEFNKRRFIGYSKEHLDQRGGGRISKAHMILNFLKECREEALFSKDIVEALKAYGVKPWDIMANVRRFERKRLVYVRGYKMDERQTPFKRGYLITWLDPEKERERAVDRNDSALEGQASSSPLMERVHRIRGVVLEHSKLRDLVSHTYIENKLECTRHEANRAVGRGLQLTFTLYYMQQEMEPNIKTVGETG